MLLVEGAEKVGKESIGDLLDPAQEQPVRAVDQEVIEARTSHHCQRPLATQPKDSASGSCPSIFCGGETHTHTFTHSHGTGVIFNLGDLLAAMLPLLLGLASHALVTRTVATVSTGVNMELLQCGKRAGSSSLPPVLFVHGTFHGAWAWEPWMERFAAAGVECHAVSLRGTSGSPVDQKSVKITEHVDDLKSLVRTNFRDAPPILVGHSFGGASCLKYLEAGGAASGAVLMCSVPPSGNGPMVGRFIRRSLKQAWLITIGFAMKKAATDTQVCRDLFFDERTPLEEVASYLPRLEADSRVGLDVGHFVANLPSKQARDDGVAKWLGTPARVPTLVLGAERDAVVDREGVEETATFLGVEGQAEFFDLPHDMMLCSGCEAPADRIIEWVKGLSLSSSGA